MINYCVSYSCAVVLKSNLRLFIRPLCLVSVSDKNLSGFKMKTDQDRSQEAYCPHHSCDWEFVNSMAIGWVLVCDVSDYVTIVQTKFHYSLTISVIVVPTIQTSIISSKACVKRGCFFFCPWDQTVSGFSKVGKYRWLDMTSNLVKLRNKGLINI